MKFAADKKFLYLPINDAAEQRKLFFYIGGKQVFELDAKLDSENPAFIANIDLSRFAGNEIELVIEPDFDLEIKLSDEECLNTNYNDPRRPAAHFTVREGWHNDPNGMLEYTSPVTGKKTYHMFYQYNPCSKNWGNMHWGHAVSEDLVHWKQIDTVLFPDDKGTMYSGSAIIDKENRAGFKTDSGEDPILLFYTTAGNRSKMTENLKFTQCLAYSTDGGMTFTKYENNPIIEHIEAMNRDPKVIWCEELGKYILALFLDRYEYALFTSDDFKHWEELQRIVIPFERECPDIYPLTVEETGERKWILSGACHRYLVGDFTNGKFVPCTETRYMLEQGFAGRHGHRGGIEPMSKTLYYGHISYASQSFSDVSDGRRINMAWDRIQSGGEIFNSQMGVPMVHTLHLWNGDYYLCANPVKELEALQIPETRQTAVIDSRCIKRHRGWFFHQLKPFSFDFGEGATDLTFHINGNGICEITINDAVLTFDTVRNITLLNGQYFAPIRFIGDSCITTIRMIIDECSVEMFNNKGEVYSVFQHFLDGKCQVSVKAGLDVYVKVSAVKLSRIF